MFSQNKGLDISIDSIAFYVKNAKGAHKFSYLKRAVLLSEELKIDSLLKQTSIEYAKQSYFIKDTLGLTFSTNKLLKHFQLKKDSFSLAKAYHLEALNHKLKNNLDSTFYYFHKSKNISMAICTNKQERLAIDLLKKIKLFDYFDYIAGCDTFEFNKPDPRHLTNIIEILDGDKKKSLMFGDSEADANAAKAASIPVILLENGYTEKNTDEIYHNHLIKDFIGVEKIVSTYLKD